MRVRSFRQECFPFSVSLPPTHHLCSLYTLVMLLASFNRASLFLLLCLSLAASVQFGEFFAQAPDPTGLVPDAIYNTTAIAFQIPNDANTWTFDSFGIYLNLITNPLSGTFKFDLYAGDNSTGPSGSSLTSATVTQFSRPTSGNCDFAGFSWAPTSSIQSINGSSRPVLTNGGTYVVVIEYSTTVPILVLSTKQVTIWGFNRTQWRSSNGFAPCLYINANPGNVPQNAAIAWTSYEQHVGNFGSGTNGDAVFIAESGAQAIFVTMDVLSVTGANNYALFSIEVNNYISSDFQVADPTGNTFNFAVYSSMNNAPSGSPLYTQTINGMSQGIVRINLTEPVPLPQKASRYWLYMASDKFWTPAAYPAMGNSEFGLANGFCTPNMTRQSSPLVVETRPQYRYAVELSGYVRTDSNSPPPTQSQPATTTPAAQTTTPSSTTTKPGTTTTNPGSTTTKPGTTTTNPSATTTKPSSSPASNRAWNVRLLSIVVAGLVALSLL